MIPCPHINVWIHFVWSTHERTPLLSHEIRHEVFDHIRENAKSKNIFIGALNGWLEHVHCLVSLGGSQSMDDIMRLLKGESSHWVNQRGLTETKFKWQDEYFAVSVSEALVPKVRSYIDNQEHHHQKRSFVDEYEDFLARGGFKRYPDPLG